jgi:excisionase family DNA binding protein
MGLALGQLATVIDRYPLYNHPVKQIVQDEGGQLQTEKSVNPPGDILTPEQAAQHLHCGRSFLYELLRVGAIPSFKVGKLRRVRRSDVDAYVASRLEDSM